VTPAHDLADWACAQRHSLPAPRLFDERGCATALAGAHADTNRFELRAIVIDALKQSGAYRGGEDHAMHVPRCSRSGDVIELMPMPQWCAWVGGACALCFERI
jgi:valyl-tRNA synthetase